MRFSSLRYAAAGLVLGLALTLRGPALAQEAVSVDALVKSMTDTLAGATSMTLHVEKSFDDVLVTGEKLNYAGAIDIALRRPDRLFISYGDDLSAKEIWYDGRELTIVDHRAGVYGRVPAKPTIDAMLDEVAETYDLHMPLAGLLGADAYAAFSEHVVEARYVGLHDVEGRAAHHVWFADETKQWQVWIDAGDVPLPLKLVVSYVTEPGEPQSIFLFTEWNLDADLPDDLFSSDIPEGAAFAAFLPRKGE